MPPPGGNLPRHPLKENVSVLLDLLSKFSHSTTSLSHADECPPDTARFHVVLDHMPIVPTQWEASPFVLLLIPKQVHDSGGGGAELLIVAGGGSSSPFIFFLRRGGYIIKHAVSWQVR